MMVNCSVYNLLVCVHRLFLTFVKYSIPKRRSSMSFFWAEDEKFISKDIGTAVDDRRQCQVTHLAKEISIRDFQEQVLCHCPGGSIILSDEYAVLAKKFVNKSCTSPYKSS